MDSVWHSAPDSRSVPPKDVAATVLNPMSKNISSDPVGLLWNPCWVLGLHGGCFGRAFFWDPWGGPLVLWDSFGDQAATKWEPDGDQLGPSGDHMRSSGDQMGPSEDQVGPGGDRMGTKWKPSGDQQRTC